jgi:hypothetical protein
VAIVFSQKAKPRIESKPGQSTRPHCEENLVQKQVPAALSYQHQGEKCPAWRAAKHFVAHSVAQIKRFYVKNVVNTKI